MYRRNEVVKVNRNWLVFLADQLDMIGKAVKEGRTELFPGANPIPEHIGNLGIALRKQAEEGK